MVSVAIFVFFRTIWAMQLWNVTRDYRQRKKTAAKLPVDSPNGVFFLFGLMMRLRRHSHRMCFVPADQVWRYAWCEDANNCFQFSLRFFACFRCMVFPTFVLEHLLDTWMYQLYRTEPTHKQKYCISVRLQQVRAYLKFNGNSSDGRAAD